MENFRQAGVKIAKKQQETQGNGGVHSNKAQTWELGLGRVERVMDGSTRSSCQDIKRLNRFFIILDPFFLSLGRNSLLPLTLNVAGNLGTRR
jgi:hypothetical protein